MKDIEKALAQLEGLAREWQGEGSKGASGRRGAGPFCADRHARVGRRARA